MKELCHTEASEKEGERERERDGKKRER